MMESTRNAIVVIISAVALMVFAGCATSGPHSDCDLFQKTRGDKAHSMKGRIYNPNDGRYQHERHAIDQTSDY